jgi:large subunit ribosomal protein L13
MSQKTVFLRKEDAEKGRRWFLVDAEGHILGRLASRVASVLHGKHKAIFTPHVDGGDHVIVINAQGVVLTGRKLKDKVYYRHSGYPSGIRATSAEEMMKTHPERVIEIAVRGMLPKNSLGRAMLRKLKVYRGGDHPHEAQRPEPLDL